MKRLEVYYHGVPERLHVGTLAHHGSDLLFEYSADALDKGLEFSPLSAKLRRTAYANMPDYQAGLPGFIADCLPRGWSQHIQNLQSTDSAPVGGCAPSALDRLSRLSRNALGALSFEPTRPFSCTASALDLLDIARQVQGLHSMEIPGGGTDLAYLSANATGASPKILVSWNESTNLFHPWSSEDSAWLIKFPAKGQHKDACAVEHMYSQLAQQCGIEMPRTRYFELDELHSALGVERFDVLGEQKLHMHTLAGVLHAEGTAANVDYVTFLRVTQTLCRDVREAQKAFRRAVFNVVFNCRGDHPHSFSFLMSSQGRWRLSPGYGFTFSHAPTHRMPLCGYTHQIPRGALQELAKKADIDPRYANRVIDEVASVAQRMPLLVEQVAHETGVRPTAMMQIADAVSQNLASLGCQGAL